MPDCRVEFRNIWCVCVVFDSAAELYVWLFVGLPGNVSFVSLAGFLAYYCLGR